MATEDAQHNLIETKDVVELNFHQVFLECEIGLVVLDSNYRLVSWNPWFTKHSGISIDKVLGKKLINIFPVLKKSSIQRAIISATKDGMSSVVSHTLNRKPFPLKNSNESFLQQHILVKPIQLENQKSFCLIQITDVSSSVNREKQLIQQANRTKEISENFAQQKERAQVTLDSIADAVITTDKAGNILSMNPVAEVLTGIFEEQAKSRKVEQFFKLIDEETQASIPCPVKQCLQQQKVVANDNDHILLGSKGAHFSITDSVAPIIDKHNQLLGAVLVFSDVTQSRALSVELNWQALHDPLTGLTNRRQFEAKMKDLLQKAKSDQVTHHLLYLDLDQFKVVNDTCGHDAGDELLKQVTATLEKKIRHTDLFSRLGGDEFGVLLEGCDAGHAIELANILRQAVEDFRFAWHERSFKIGVSIGIAEITGTEAKATEILSAADAACYIAKESGRNRVHFHELNSSASSAHQQEMQWVSRIQYALDNDKFELYLQRIQDITLQGVASDHYEVLVRMVNDEGGLTPPGSFLPAAERFNLIANLDRWVVENVFKRLEKLKINQKIPDDLILSINLSGASMVDYGLLDRVSYLLEKSHFPAQYFCFEITETAAIANLKQAIQFLSRLRSHGCKIALDDFGSGLSSFAYLKSLPIDYLKIDGHFVKDIATDNIDKVFVESIHQIGLVMGLSTIAEFVENDAILKVLTEIGVNYAQGYGVHKPCAFDEVFGV